MIFDSAIGHSVILTRSYKLVNYFSPITLILSLVLICYVIVYRRRRQRIVKLIDKIPGPPGLPFIGNTIEINVDHDELFARVCVGGAIFNPNIIRGWVGQKPWIIIYHHELVEPILSNPKQIDKSYDYEFLQPWLGTGLLTSHGQKWHSRRKILTPAFHFKILEDFIDVFNEQSVILVSKMKSEVGKDSFNIFPYVTLCTLDVICETACSHKLNAQNNSDSEYVRAVYDIGAIILSRQAKMWLQPEFIFRMTDNYKKHQKCLEILHEFSYRVIRERKEEIAKMKHIRLNDNNNNIKDNRFDNNNVNTNTSDTEEEFGKKKRLAFLDLLIEASQEGTVLSNDDIREEVDTFMFEGHDTTSAAISWSLFLLGSHPIIQDRVYDELYDIFGNDKNRSATMNDLLQMKYLECCIKEALRLYPSVPLIARKIKEDVNIGEYTIPAGTTAMIVTYMLHRNSDIYPKPEQFDPDRFSPENCHGRHPYAYIPFSAGLRNCIGQKFAILEEKSILSRILRNYKIEAIDRREDLTLLGELILRPKSGLRIKITPRN